MPSPPRSRRSSLPGRRRSGARVARSLPADLGRGLAGLALCLAALAFAGCSRGEDLARPRAASPPASAGDPSMPPDPNRPTEVATLGAGCFWCVEAVLEQVDGIVDVQSGYMGGHVADPTYRQVCTGTTGHAEVVQVTFDPAVISYAELLDWFWRLHDPTTPDRQGNDVGTQYRSAIFVHSPAQRAAAETSRAAAQAHFAAPIVTEITDAGPFYGAEDYHQDYYRLNKSQGYCRLVIAPKLDKLGLEQ